MAHAIKMRTLEDSDFFVFNVVILVKRFSLKMMLDVCHNELYISIY